MIDNASKVLDQCEREKSGLQRKLEASAVDHSSCQLKEL
jgi:hypothetical protein